MNAQTELTIPNTPEEAAAARQAFPERSEFWEANAKSARPDVSHGTINACTRCKCKTVFLVKQGRLYHCQCDYCLRQSATSRSPGRAVKYWNKAQL